MGAKHEKQTKVTIITNKKKRCNWSARVYIHDWQQIPFPETCIHACRSTNHITGKSSCLVRFRFRFSQPIETRPTLQALNNEQKIIINSFQLCGRGALQQFTTASNAYHTRQNHHPPSHYGTAGCNDQRPSQVPPRPRPCPPPQPPFRHGRCKTSRRWRMPSSPA